MVQGTGEKMSDVTDFHDFQYHFDYLTGWTELLENQLPGDEWSDVLRAAGYNPYPIHEFNLRGASRVGHHRSLSDALFFAEKHKEWNRAEYSRDSVFKVYDNSGFMVAEFK